MIREDFLFPMIDVGLVSDDDLEHLGRLFDIDSIKEYIRQEKIRIRDDQAGPWTSYPVPLLAITKGTPAPALLLLR